MNKQELGTLGFTILNNVYSEHEIAQLSAILEAVNVLSPDVRQSNEVFAIRRFLKEVPEAAQLLFSNNLKTILKGLLGHDFFLVKSIYFNKPQQANWFVAWHQDLTISVDTKIDCNGYGPWTTRQSQIAVQPPLQILESIYTVRIHLDDTDQNNGALRVIPGSHRKGIYRPETINRAQEKESICCVPKGGIHVLRPLLLHSSSRSSNRQRRVIHLEFSNHPLAGGLNWAEKMEL